MCKVHLGKLSCCSCFQLYFHPRQTDSCPIYVVLLSTGKTITLAAMVASIGEAIVVAPSNAAVANVAVKILSFAGQFSLQNLILFGENCDESVRFLSPLHRSRYFRKFLDYRKKQGSRKRKELLEEFTKWLRLDTAAYLKSKKSVPQLLLFGFAKWLHLPQPDGVSIEVIEALCPRVDDSEKGQRVLRNLLADSKVVLCTLNTAGSTFLRRALGGRFNTLFLDEAAQVSFAPLYTVISINEDANSPPVVHSIR